MLRLSTADIETALAGLSPAERAELLGLLETREKLKVEPPPDPRPSIEEMLEQVRQEAAARSADPEAYLRADAEHDRARRLHMYRLLENRTTSPVDDIEAWMRELAEAMSEATALARADGFPPADEVVPDARSQSVAPCDGVDADRLPTATRRDVEQTRAVASWPRDAVSGDSEVALPKADNLRVVHEWDRYLDPSAEDR